MKHYFKVNLSSFNILVLLSQTLKEIAMQVLPYLFFDGRCEEAANFYCSTLGAEITMLMRMKDGPEPTEECKAQIPAGSENKIMHMSLRIGEGTVHASDGRCQGKPDFKGFSLSLNPSNDAEAERLFAALAEGGQVQMPMGKTFYASRFGMVVDRFGVSWMVIVPS